MGIQQQQQQECDKQKKGKFLRVWPKEEQQQKVKAVKTTEVASGKWQASKQRWQPRHIINFNVARELPATSATLTVLLLSIFPLFQSFFMTLLLLLVAGLSSLPAWLALDLGRQILGKSI